MILSTGLTLNKQAKGARVNIAEVVTQILSSHTCFKSLFLSPQSFDKGNVRSSMNGSISPSCPMMILSFGSLSKSPAANNRRMWSPTSECHPQQVVDSIDVT